MLNDLQSIPDPISGRNELESPRDTAAITLLHDDGIQSIFSDGARILFSTINALLLLPDLVNKMLFKNFLATLEKNKCPADILTEVRTIIYPEIWSMTQDVSGTGRRDTPVTLLLDLVSTIACRETAKLVKSENYAALQRLIRDPLLCDYILFPTQPCANNKFDFSRLGAGELCNALFRGMQHPDKTVKWNALQIARKAKETNRDLFIPDDLFKKFCLVIINNAVKIDDWAPSCAMWLIAHTKVTHNESLSNDKIRLIKSS